MNRWLRCLRAPALAGVFVGALLLTGCATPQMATLAQRWPGDLPAATLIEAVPFFPQDDYQCGPAALAMAARAAGVAVTPEDLVEQVYLPSRQGSLQLEMLAASRRQGLPAYLLAPKLEALLREVTAGHPVIVLQNLAFSFAPLWHYAVVIGFDRSRNQLILHSGRTERMEMSLFTFERTWARGDHWAMVALAPTRLPVTAEPDAYAASVAALERVDPRAAQTAYATALQAWPTHRGALLGAGNTAHALGQLDRAATAYRTATRAYADFADAWNNLAQVLLEQGQKAEASEAIARAVAFGGPRLPRYLELQQKINTK
ncbi:MAG: PA2778 family cysteine peptidase [Burkholderiaceae bacterium]